MIQLKILTGKMAGATWAARRFPVRVGRSSACDLQIEEPGVWDEHFEIELNRRDGFILKMHPNTRVGSEGGDQTFKLRNGDVIEIGALKLQFWIGEATQRGLRIRETFVWTTVAVVTFTQIALIYWLVTSS